MKQINDDDAERNDIAARVRRRVESLVPHQLVDFCECVILETYVPSTRKVSGPSDSAFLTFATASVATPAAAATAVPDDSSDWLSPAAAAPLIILQTGV